MSREKFEKSNLFKYYSDHVKFIEFNGDSYKFNELSKGLSQMQLACMTVSIISINAGWSAWQEQQNVIDKLESQLRGQKIALDIFSQNERCKHFSTTMFHNGKAECFQCNAIVNEKREVIGQQGKGLFNKESEP